MRRSIGLLGLVAVTATVSVATAAVPAATPVGALTQPAGIQGCVYTPPPPEDEEQDRLRGRCAETTSLEGVDGVAVSPEGRNVYAVGYDAGTLSAFARDPATGTLRKLPGAAGCIEEASDSDCAGGTAMQNPTAVAVTPDGRHVYLVSFLSDSVVGFARGAAGGLTQLAPADGCVSRGLTEEVCGRGWALDRPVGLAVAPDGRNVYVASSDSNGVAVFGRDPATGNLRQLAGSAACVVDELARAREDPDPNDERCAVGRALASAGAVSVSPDGRNVYVASLEADSVSIFARDAATGALTQLAGPDGCLADTALPEERAPPSCGRARALDGPFAVDVSPDGRNVYVVTGFGNNGPDPTATNGVAVFSRDAATGRLVQLAGSAGCVTEAGGDGCADGTALRGALAVTVSRDGRNVYVASGNSDAIAVFSRDRATGALTQLAGQLGCLSPSEPGVCAEARGLTGAYAVAASPDGRNVYAAGPFDDAIATFARSAARPLLLRSTLTGASARPAGDPDGFGSARLTLEDQRVCWRISVRRVGRPVAIHIHRGRPGRRGPIVLTLRPASGTLLAGCRPALADDVAPIMRQPVSYYVDVHTRDYARGALRGQLRRG